MCETGVDSMKKLVIAGAALLTLFGVVGCATVGKAPIGKEPVPVVSKG
jgi:hypothetical protein